MSVEKITHHRARATAIRQDRMLRVYLRREPHAAAVHAFIADEILPHLIGLPLTPDPLKATVEAHELIDIYTDHILARYPFLDRVGIRLMIADLVSIQAVSFEPTRLDMGRSQVHRGAVTFMEWVENSEHLDADNAFSMDAFTADTGFENLVVMHDLVRAGVLDHVTDSEVSVDFIVTDEAARLDYYL